MSEKIETITIHQCPKCAGTHTFQLSVRRTTVMLLSDEDKKEKVKTVTCLFNCPSTGGTFQARLKLTTPAREKIISVEVQPAAKRE